MGCRILRARERTCPHRSHWDFEIETINGWRTVEHKGSKTLRTRMYLERLKRPWAVGVQFANLGTGSVPYLKCYAWKWYVVLIESGLLKDKYKIEADTPTYDEFLSDCGQQGSAKTPFALELKKIVKRMKESGISAPLAGERELVNSLFNSCQHCLDKLGKEIHEISCEVLEAKDYWINVVGDLNGDYRFRWFPAVSLPPLTSVKLDKTQADLIFEFECESGFTYHGGLRWGNGLGLANIRFDLK